MSLLTQNQRSLKIFIKFKQKDFTLDIDSSYDNVVDMRRVVDSVQKTIDSEIGLKTHVFEIFDEKSLDLIKITKKSQFVSNLAVIRVSAKPHEEFTCFVNFCDNNHKNFEFRVLVDKCYDEYQKYEKILDKCWEICEQNPPKDYSFEIFDEKSKTYINLDKSNPIIPNQSVIRIKSTTVEETNAENNQKPLKSCLKPEIKSCESLLQKINDLVLKDNQEVNGSDDQKTTEDNKSKDKQNVRISLKNKNSNQKERSGATNGQISDKTTDSNNFDSTEDMIDYYLSLAVCQCLKISRQTFTDPIVFWKAVSVKLVNEYKLNTIDDIECKKRFEDMIQRYINVLKTSRNLNEANNSFKCFGIFNTIDLNLFLTPNIYQLVVELRYKLWNGFNKPPVNSQLSYYSGCGLPRNPMQQNYYPPYYQQMSPNLWYFPNYSEPYNPKTQRLVNREPTPDPTIQRLVKIESIDEKALKQQVLKCSSIEEQLAIFRERVLFTEKDYQKRNELKNILQKILKESGLDCVLHFFGSTTNSLGFRTSDIDLFLELKEENNFCHTIGYERAISCLKQIRTTFQKSLRLSTIAEPVESRRCPIIKLDFNSLAQISRKSKKSIKSGISCDISLTNGLGVINTKLIRLYCEFERRFQDLALIVRFWGKNNSFIDGLNGFTSYALTQLVIFFGQSLSPPLLPTVDQLIDMAEESVIIDGRECKLCEDVNRIPKSQNTDSLFELLVKFFKFYANFDFTTQVIRPKTGLTVHKKVAKDLKLMRNQKNIADVINFKMSSMVSIEDPFNLSHNLTANIKYEIFDRFLEYIKHIDLKSDMIFTQNKSENDANDWGISKIITKFDPTDGYQSVFGRHIFHPMVRQILESPETTAQSMISAMIKEYFDLILLSMERVFRVRPQIKINTELSEYITPFAEYTIETKGIHSKIFDSKERTDIMKGLKLNKKTKKQRIDKEVGITDEIISKFKDKPIDENPVKFQFCLLCYTRPSGPYIELNTFEVSPEESNVRKTLKELFEWIPKLIEDKQKS